MNRLSWTDYFFNIAAVVSTRSTCIRRHYGAVIVKDNRIIATGYNGAACGEQHCIDKGCWREEHNIPHGTQYEKCVSIHAEANAIMQAGIQNCYGGTLYLVGFDMVEKKSLKNPEPCEMCARLIKNAKLQVVTSYVDYAIQVLISNSNIGVSPNDIMQLSLLLKNNTIFTVKSAKHPRSLRYFANIGECVCRLELEDGEFAGKNLYVLVDSCDVSKLRLVEHVRSVDIL